MPTTTKIRRVHGRLPDARRKAVRRQVGRVVDRWWTEDPVDRRYFDLVLESGEHACVFRDEEAGVTFGRPVGVTVDPRGALLIADDLANIVWRVSRVGGAAQPVDAVPAVDAPDDTAQPSDDHQPRRRAQAAFGYALADDRRIRGHPDCEYAVLQAV